MHCLLILDRDERFVLPLTYRSMKRVHAFPPLAGTSTAELRISWHVVEQRPGEVKQVRTSCICLRSRRSRGCPDETFLCFGFLSTRRRLQAFPIITTQGSRKATHRSMSGKLVLDVAHRTAVLGLIGGSIYGTYFITSCYMELRRKADPASAAAIEAQKVPVAPPK